MTQIFPTPIRSRRALGFSVVAAAMLATMVPLVQVPLALEAPPWGDPSA